LPLPDSNNTILCNISQDEPRVIVPSKFRRKAFKTIHSLDHAEIKSTLYMLKQKFCLTTINRDVRD